MKVVLHPANIGDREGDLLLKEIIGKFHRLKLIWADNGYRMHKLTAWVKEALGVKLQIYNSPGVSTGTG